MSDVGTVAAAWPWLAAAAAGVLLAAVAGYAKGRRDGRSRATDPPAHPAAGVHGVVQDVIAAHDLATGAAAVQAALERALLSVGVRRIPVAGGTAFDARRHHAVGTTATADGRADRCVAREVRAGWQTSDRVVRPVEVIVWKR